MKINSPYRSHNIASICELPIGSEVTLSGWVHQTRDLGGLTFIELRDRSGRAQLVANAETNAELHQQFSALRSEWVIQVTGSIQEREGSPNKALATGHLEIIASKLQVLSKAETPPIAITDQGQDAEELTRLKYRYLDLRKPERLAIFEKRHKITSAVRNTLDGLGFLDVETPILTKSTPEGARDYLVPSRVQPGKFFALPQSPQLFKQMLMVSGFEKYYQIVKCFRDEDLRADRQPEFTQIDIEASFVDRDAVLQIGEAVVKAAFDAVGLPFPKQIQHLDFQDAMALYGSDKPDLRFDLRMHDLSDYCKTLDFKIFNEVANSGGAVKCIAVPNGPELFSRKIIDGFLDVVSPYGIKGLAWMHVKGEEISSPIAKFFSEEKLAELKSTLNLTQHTVLFVAHTSLDTVNQALGALRLHVGHTYNFIEKDFAAAWVLDFPLFEDDGEGNVCAVHHPFTAPHPEDIDQLGAKPFAVRSLGYDFVLNGYEIGGGSIRIHQSDLQEQIFRLLQLSTEDIDQKFGFFVNALKYGTPPHGGIAFGLDRLAMILSGASSIRDVIAFPKTTNAGCPLTLAPSPVDDAHLAEELFLKSLANADSPA